MAVIHLVEGAVGAGKSTFAGRLALQHSAPLLNLDQWMVTLFRPDRPETDFMSWYAERKLRCIDQIWVVATELIDRGTDAVLELGLVQLADREDFYRRIDAAGYELQIYWLDTPEDLRRARVRQRNLQQGSTYQMEVTDEIFEIANRAWQAPDARECAERGIRIVAE